ncbi:endonuclease [Parabacteroides sp. 52]|uniref:endonuclease/exonuclease/phosphatase family protein n=1 Tax=unclassified Parabacteroides TaxID=2649774 RepID=UPI0013D48A20|nr:MULTISPECIES: endonuclease/exonuclease/phosphatase family protein [unclassified Parabacteroides]MDH6533422.1 endonuclease/exonuclease/phosphatase family metal-dependent hydrolase/predicted phosphodiesterase [Parabacteroides sp. PM5-20]NDV54179.1 endonuclease [Parabacteroides sp. 52]
MKRILIGLTLFIGMLPFSDVYSQRLGDAEDNTYRIMSYNFRNGKGLDNVTDLQRVADAINRMTPDVVAVQEVDSMTARSGQRDVLRELANQTLMYPIYAPAISYDGGKYGIGMLSKEKPLRSYSIPLPGREERRTLLVVEFDKFMMACSHFSLNKEDRFTSVDLIRKEAEKADKPFIIAGDLNARPDSPVIEELQKHFSILSNPKQFTFPANEPRECIDYIAAYKTENMPFTVLSSRVVEEPVASDHRPVMVNIRFHATQENIFYASPYLQNPVDGGITVMWQTRVPAYSWVEYGTDTLHLKRERTLVDGQVICNDLHNKIRLSGLQPGQTYYYRVCSQEILVYQAYKKVFGQTATSPFYSFTLPEADTKDFTALVFNDIHKQEATLKGLYNLVKDVDYDFVFFNGDCIDDPANEKEALFHIAMQCETVGAANRPVFYLRGNHEIRNAYSIGLRELFDYVGDKTYGAFSWGDTRFVMLDCGEDKPDTTWVYYGLNDFTQLREDQVGFLKEELASSVFTQAGKRVLVNHIPLYGNRMGGYQPSFALWGSLLEKAPFDINISAHTHRHAYYAKGEVRNNFPVVVGGSQRLDTATVMVLQKKGKEMTLQVWNGKGEIVYDLKL